jgi:APA family basic amino acid/polyamine antiporter
VTKFGDKNGLKPELGYFSATNIVIANIIGAGIFTTSGLLMEDLGSPRLMLSLWLLGGIIALCGAVSYGELGAAMPHSGGEYYFLSRVFHPVLGFLSGWVSLIVGFSAPVAASALGFGEYLLGAFPQIANTLMGGSAEVVRIFPKIAALLVIAVFSAVHLKGIRLGSRVQNTLTIIKVFLIAAVITAGLLSGNGTLSNLNKGESPGSGLSGLSTIGLALMWIMFAFSGWNASAYLGSEIRKPERNLPASLLTGTVIVTILYLLMNLVYVKALEPDEMKGVISVGGLAMGALFGRGSEILFSLIISFALLSSLSAFIIIGPRVYYAMARDGLFFRTFSRVNPQKNVPSNSIILQGMMASVFVVTGSFEQILTYMGFSLGIFPVIAVAGLIKLRLSDRVPVRLPGFPVAQIVFIIASSAILVLAFIERPAESLVALATLLAGIPVYFLFRNRKPQNQKQ